MRSLPAAIAKPFRVSKRLTPTIAGSLLLLLEGSCAPRFERRGPACSQFPLAPGGVSSLLTSYEAPPTFSFEPNRGQVGAPARFVARGPAARMLFTPVDVEIAVSGPAGRARVRLRLLGASPDAPMRGVGELPGATHYLLGSDPSGWITDVPAYARLQVEEAYPGIDVVYREECGRLAYDFVVASGADPGLIRLALEGAQEVRLDPTGELVIETDAGELRQRPPFLYQEDGGAREEVRGGYALRGPAEVGFLVPAYDRARPLVIDPALLYATYQGGCRGYQGIQDVAVDGNGNAYVAGYHPWDCDGGAPDAYVAKFAPTGALLFRTNFGGWFGDQPNAVAVDAAGDVYVTGGTTSSLCCRPFPVVNPLQADNAGGMDAFVTKLDATGRTILFSTFLGGSGEDRGADLEVDASGTLFLTGTTTSTDFPTAGAAQPLPGGDQDAFVAALDPEVPALVFSTYLGGGGADVTARLVVAGSGLLVAGTTGSPDFPVRAGEAPGPAQTAFGGGVSDAFVARYTPAGSLEYATYLGGSGRDEAYGVAADSTGAGHVTGGTDSPDFPATNPMQSALSHPPEADAFLTRISPDGTQLLHSTYLGVGRAADCPAASVSHAPCGAIAVDGAGNAFVTAPGVFVMKVDAAGADRPYTFQGFGGSGIALTPAGEILVAGRTGSPLLPTLNAHETEHDTFEIEEGWLAKLQDGPNPGSDFMHDDPRVVYTGAWVVEEAPDQSCGNATRSSEAGATAAITFTGTGIQLIGRRDPEAGFARVSLDDDPLRQGLLLDTYGSPAEPRALLLSWSGLTYTSHTLTLEVAGARGARSGGDWVWIDGFRVLGGMSFGIDRPGRVSRRER